MSLLSGQTAIAVDTETTGMSPAFGHRLVEVARPEPAGTEVLVRVAGCGVCRTDLHVVDGTQPRVELPRTLGHEVAGTIEAAGPDADHDHQPGRAHAVPRPRS